MKQNIPKSIQKGLDFLAKSQNTSGKFSSLEAADKAISEPVKNDGIFASALILDCLNGISSAESICAKATDYLLRHKTREWTWNYWERGSDARPYPDDWDDTACSVAALVGYDPDLVDVTAQARLAQQLIAGEVAPGGPYKTWLLAGEASQWSDVDPVVNANIGYMLMRLGVQLPSLEQYITDCISHNKLKSPYYVGMIPTVYFMARWYRGPKQHVLEQLVLEHLRNGADSVMEQAMLVTAAINLDAWSAVTDIVMQKILATQQSDGSWPAWALYYEPPQNGTWRYAGSRQLSTAFVVEALSKWQIADVPAANNPRKDVASIAQSIARAGNWQINDTVINLLDRASQQGWAAYTLYDDIWDGEGDAATLSDANKAMRKSVKYFTAAIADESFPKFVYEAFDQVDTANSWEHNHARNIFSPPDYGDCLSLADRSWGHVIAPTGVLVAAGYLLDGPEVHHLHNFFRHYIVARQLCDDAHDWQDDLSRGHVSPVVALVLERCSADDMQSRQKYFWEYIIDEVNQLIMHHVSQAQQALYRCEFFVDGSELQGWLDRVIKACARATQGKQQALEFMQVFRANGLVN